MSFGTALEFASGTTEDCQRLVARLFQPGEILGAYRAGRQQFRSSDLVLVTAERDASGFDIMMRAHYIGRLRRGMRKSAKMIASLGVANQSAHQVASLPAELDAMWLVINRKDALPVMVVLYAAPYATGTDAVEPSILH